MARRGQAVVCVPIRVAWDGSWGVGGTWDGPRSQIGRVTVDGCRDGFGPNTQQCSELSARSLGGTLGRVLLGADLLKRPSATPLRIVRPEDDFTQFGRLAFRWNSDDHTEWWAIGEHIGDPGRHRSEPLVRGR